MEDYKTWAVGDEVECIRDENTIGKCHEGVIVGKKYKIKKLEVRASGLHIWVRDEVGGYWATRFRKLQKRKTDISQFQAMLNQTLLTNQIELTVKERMPENV